jgi:SAM-dependent methyltransferase
MAITPFTDGVSPTQLGLEPGSVVLDIGCADGRGTVRIADYGYVVIGVELLESLLDSLRAGSETRDLIACRGDATSLPMPDASVDGVALIEVLEHIPETAATLAEIRRVVRPGGRVCIAVPTGYSERIYGRLHPRYVANAEHIHRFDRRGLTAQLEAAGITVERVATRNLAPATSWLIHALLRTDADATGKVLRRAWIDRWVAGGYWALRKMPVVRSLVAWLEARVGKSWYFYGAVD